MPRKVRRAMSAYDFAMDIADTVKQNAPYDDWDDVYDAVAEVMDSQLIYTADIADLLIEYLMSGDGDKTVEDVAQEVGLYEWIDQQVMDEIDLEELTRPDPDELDDDTAVEYWDAIYDAVSRRRGGR